MTTSPQPRVWFITGASRGLGKAFASAALKIGDHVVAASRTIGKNSGDERILNIPLDVTDRKAVFEAVELAVQHFGRIDVLVNNAGTMSSGFVEEFTEEQARDQMETNFFGALWVSQAVMSVMREQRSGQIIQISSIGGLAGFSSTGLYSASKFALEGMSEALAMEASPFGVTVTIVQPGGYWTDLYAAMTMTDEIPEYSSLRTALAEQFADGSIDSAPELAATAILELSESKEPPLRLLLGSMVYDLAFDVSQKRMDTWAAWEKTSRAAEHAIPAPDTHSS